MTARELLDRHLVWDNHGCLPLRPLDESFLPQLWRYREAGVDHVSINVGMAEMGIEAHVRMLATLRRWLGLHGDRYRLVRGLDDIDAARASGLLAVSFDIEGANAVADQLSLVSLYHELGVRWMLLAYNRNSRAGGGCQDDDGGLTDFGRALIDEMQRVGMVLCLSHCGHRTAWQALEHACVPVVFSHSNPSALRPHPRNIPDELIRACAAGGGVIGINGVGPFLGDDDTRPGTLARHIDHVVQLVGPQHVGLGLDFVFDQAEIDAAMASMKDLFPPEMGYAHGMHFVPPESLEAVVDHLLRLGYREADIADILGRNWWRVARAVWRAPAADTPA